MATDHNPTADLSVIRRAASALLLPGQATELRALEVSTPAYRRPHTVSGYFDDPEALAQAAAGLDEAKGIYVVPNPINSALLARAQNRLRDVGPHDATTSDKDVVRRHWLLVDADSAPVAGVSTTDAEHEAALATVRFIRDTLREGGWPEPIVADSGNGGHLLYRIDLPIDDGGIVKRCLAALAFRFNDGDVRIDESVHNPARIWKLYGTPARKGDDTLERPHRLSRLLEVPEDLLPVPPDLLAALAASLPVEIAPSRIGPNSLSDGAGHFDLQAWLDAHLPEAIGPTPWNNGQRWVLPTCVWNGHTNRSAYIVQFPSGAVAAGCHHNSCQGYGWRELRQHFESGWSELQTSRQNSVNSVHSVQASPLSDEWDLPVPFFHADVPPFPTVALPGMWREYVEAVAIATQTPPDLAALLSLSVVAAACAKRVEVEVREGWIEPVNLFTAIALPPGSRKTAVLSEVTEPLDEYERAEGHRMAPEIAEATARYKIMESRLQQLQAQAAKAKPDEGDALAREATTVARELAATRVPVAPRLIADDATPEKIATMLRDHGGRLAVLSAEGDVFDLLSGRYGNGANFGVFLKGHAGDTLRVDRVNRPPEYVKRPALTVGLAVQPDVIRGLVMQPSFRGRGLLGRFLYAWPPSPLGGRDTNAPAVPEGVRAAYKATILGLLSIQPMTDEDGNSAPHVLCLNATAQDRLRTFERWIEPQLAEVGELAAISDWAGKLVGAVARIAGLLHMTEQEAGQKPWRTIVEDDTVRRAIRIGEYLIPHALATFAEMGATADVEGARILLAWIIKRGQESFTMRDAHVGCRGRLKKAEDVAAALRVLERHGYVRERPVDIKNGPGRPASRILDVCPYVLVLSTSREPSLNGRAKDGAASGTNRAVPAEHNSHNSHNSNVVALATAVQPSDRRSTPAVCVVCGATLGSGEWLRCRGCGEAGLMVQSAAGGS